MLKCVDRNVLHEKENKLLALKAEKMTFLSFNIFDKTEKSPS